MVHSMEAWPFPTTPVFRFLQKVATIHTAGSQTLLPPSLQGKTDTAADSFCETHPGCTHQP